VFRTRFERTVREVQYNGARIGLSGRRRDSSPVGVKEPIREIELELCDGASSALFGLALDLVGRGAMRWPWYPASTPRRPADIGWPARWAASDQCRSGRIAGLLQPQLSSAEAARPLVGRTALYRVLANVQGAAVERIRICAPGAGSRCAAPVRPLRVLATATAADDPIAPRPAWMADCFGQVRDWDVRLAHSLPALRARSDRVTRG